MSKGPVRWVLGALAFSLGPLWLMALLGIRGNRLFILKTLPYTILIFLPLAFTADTERALCMYAPIVIPLAMCPLQAAAPDRKLLPLWGGLFVILVFASQAIFLYRFFIRQIYDVSRVGPGRFRLILVGSQK